VVLTYVALLVADQIKLARTAGLKKLYEAEAAAYLAELMAAGLSLEKDRV
jgi:hypothetical protein